jgi:hypothetical protein
MREISTIDKDPNNYAGLNPAGTVEVNAWTTRRMRTRKCPNERITRRNANRSLRLRDLQN